MGLDRGFLAGLCFLAAMGFILLLGTILDGIRPLWSTASPHEKWVHRVVVGSIIALIGVCLWAALLFGGAV